LEKTGPSAILISLIHATHPINSTPVINHPKKESDDFCYFLVQALFHSIHLFSTNLLQDTEIVISIIIQEKQQHTVCTYKICEKFVTVYVSNTQ